MLQEPRVAVLGAGYWGKNIVRNFAELGALAGVVEPDAKAADDVCAVTAARV
jgi:UDP-2-acetamido-3-amino-2,3-dideoxy-glucuronate N-acetyltransferase